MRAALLLALAALACSKTELPASAPPVQTTAIEAPRLVALPEEPVRTTEGEKLFLDLAALSSDGKGSPVVAARDLPPGAQVVGRRLEWTPDYQSAGKYTVTLVACDRGACMEQPLDIVVDDEPNPPRAFKKPCETLPPSHPDHCPAAPPANP